MTLEIERLTKWTEPREVMTRKGPRMLRKGPVSETFWAAWREEKPQLQAAGISCAQDRTTGKWEICHWLPMDRATVAKREEAKAASRALDTDFEVPCPEGLSFRGYQKAGIKFALDTFARSGCLIGDECGLGKTPQAIGILNSRPDIKRVLIVCPKTVKQNWERELRRWLTRPLKVGRQEPGCSYVGIFVDVVIINPDLVRKFASITGENWDLIILDESHYYKNPKAIRTKTVMSIAAKNKLAMTGTPILNRPVELWTTLSWLDPKTWDPKKGFFRYAMRYCGAKRNKFGWDFDGNSHEAELQDKLRGTIMVRRMKADVLTELPPKQREVVELDVPGTFSTGIEELDVLEARVQLAEAAEDAQAFEEAVAALEEGTNHAFEEISKVRHAIAVAKLPQAIEYIEDALEAGPVIVFAHHLDVIAEMKRHLPQAAVIVGATKDRQAEVDRFMNDPACNVFLGNQAAAEGITLTKSSRVIFVEGDWTPGNLAQKEDRAHRIGQRNSVLVTHLVAAGTIDATMITRTVEKQTVIDAVLDRRTTSQQAVQPADFTATIQTLTIAPGTIGTTTRHQETVRGSNALQRFSQEAPSITAEEIKLAHEAMRVLASQCDGARDQDGVGFNGVDTTIGKSFARQEWLSPKQGLLAKRLANKYRRQLGEMFASLYARKGAA